MVWTERVIETDRLRHPALVAGEGQPVLCLHGFPDTPHTFGPLAEHLVPRGWRVVAPWLRGYHPEVVPDEPHFDTATLTADAAALCAAVGEGQPVHVVGHDWGASVTYGLLAAFDERLAGAVTIAVPPPSQLVAFAARHPQQLRRSFYIWFFQLQDLPELVLANSGLLDYLWQQWSPRLTEIPHLEHVRAVFSDPARVACAIGYYRALFDDDYRDPKLSELRRRLGASLSQPVLLLGGDEDGAIDAAALRGATEDLPHGSRVEVLDGAGHFVHLERPAKVAELVDDWLRAS